MFLFTYLGIAVASILLAWLLWLIFCGAVQSALPMPDTNFVRQSQINDLWIIINELTNKNKISYVYEDRHDGIGLRIHIVKKGEKVRH